MTTPFKIDVYFLNTDGWGWALEPDENIVKHIKTYDLSLYEDNESFQTQVKLDGNGLGLHPVPAFSHIFGKIIGWTRQHNVFDIYTLWANSTHANKQSDFTVADYVVLTVDGFQFPVNRVLSLRGNRVYFYTDDFYFDRAIEVCHKNHLLSETHEKILLDFKSFEQAAICLFKYAVDTKGPSQVADLVSNFFSNTSFNPQDPDFDLFKRIIDSDTLALEFIYNCLMDKKTFGLENSHGGAIAAIELLEVVAGHGCSK